MTVPMEMHEAADIVELRAAIQERVTAVKAIFAEVLRDAELIILQADDELKRRSRAGGGTQIISGNYRIAWPRGTRAGTPTKLVTKLLELHGKITPAEFSEVFSGSTHIDTMLDVDVLNSIKALIPGADRVVKTDIQANGTALNAIKKSYGPDSEVGKIIEAGYIPNRQEYDDALTIEPIVESAHKTVVDDAIESSKAVSA